MRVTLKAINHRLAAKGHHAHLEKGDGYFYFYGGEVTDWLDRIVNVHTLSSLTVEQWIEEFEKLKTLNCHVLKPARKEKRRLSAEKRI